MRVSLIIFFIGFLTIAPSIYVGIKFFDGKVTDQPYETGLMYDQDKKFIKDNGLDVTILKHDKADGKVSLEFQINRNEGVSVQETQFFVTRPATNKGQIAITAKEEANGVYASVFDLGSMGHHILRVQGRINGKDVSLQKSFYIN